jgi:glutathione S-transferase
MPIVHGVPPSPFVRKVRVFLAEKGIAYDLKPVMPLNVTEEFKKISPLGKIPVYEDGAFTIPDSSVICAYLEKVQPEPALYPSDARDYARALFLEEYADTRLSDYCGTLFFQRLIAKNVLKQEPDEALCQQRLTQDLPPLFDWLESQVGEGDVVGNAFSIADIAIGTQLQQIRHAGEDVDPSRWPRLRAYVDRVHARPSFTACIEQERQMLASM